MTTEPYNVITIEEKDVGQYLMKALPNYVFIRKNNQNNFYVYNDLQFYDITDQQQLNDYNFSVALTTSTTIAMGKHKDVTTTNDDGDTITIHYGDVMRRTFEFHVWSVKKSNIDTSHMAEMTRLAMRGHPDMLAISTEITLYYKKLDNTLKPLQDCVFTCDLLSQETFETTGDKMDDATIEVEKVEGV